MEPTVVVDDDTEHSSNTSTDIVLIGEPSVVEKVLSPKFDENTGDPVSDSIPTASANETLKTYLKHDRKAVVRHEEMNSDLYYCLCIDFVELLLYMHVHMYVVFC